MQPDLLKLHTPVLGYRPLSALSPSRGFSTRKPHFTDQAQGSITSRSHLHTPSILPHDSSGLVDDRSSLPPLDRFIDQQYLQPSLHSTLTISSIQVPQVTSRYLSHVVSRTIDSEALLRLVKDTYIQKIKKRMIQRQQQEEQGHQTYTWKDIHPLVTVSQIRPIPHHHNNPTHHKEKNTKHY